MALTDAYGRPIKVFPLPGPNGAPSILAVALVDTDGNPVNPGSGGGGPAADYTGDKALSKRVDSVDDTTLYIGEASPGTTTSASLWRIKKVTMLPDGDTIVEWAAGNGNFDKSWDNHLSLSYS